MLLQIVAAFIVLMLGISPYASEIKDKKDQKVTRRNIGLIILMIIVFGCGVAKIWDDDKSSNENKEQLTNANKELTNINKELTKTNNRLEAASLSCKNLQNGNPQSIRACDRLKKVYENTDFEQYKKLTKSVNVEYFSKKSDVGRIKPDVEYLGFNVLQPKKDSTDKKASNAIWYAQDVDLKHIKNIAYTLIATGGDLKLIALDTTQEKGTVQIGYDRKRRDYLTVKDIDNLNQKKFANR
jgi:predicted RND superfamily exporter protein